MKPIFPQLPSKLGLYTVTERLSSRQYSELYNAYQSYVDRGVILEALRPGCDEARANYFLAAAQARAAVNLPGVSPVLESAQSGSIIYLIQEQPAGEPFTRLVRERRFSVKTAFRLVEAVAELYEAGRKQNVVVAPVTADAIYIEEKRINFLSSVSPDLPSFALQTAQMSALADLLEQAIPRALLKNSSLPTVINWLRNGYNGRPLEWSSLKSALRALRARRHSPDESSDGSGHASLRMRLRRWLREFRASARLTLSCVLLVLVVGGVGSQLIPEDIFTSSDPAVVGDRVYVEGEQVYAVKRSPVSIAEYSRFMKKWEKMSPEEREQLASGLTEDPEEFSPREPLNWEEQLSFAEEGEKLTPDSPVLGVGYCEATLYARYVGEMLATADQVLTAREHAAGVKEVEEWTSSFSPSQMPYDGCIVICPAQGKTLIYATDDQEQVPQRGFRTVSLIDAQ